MSSHDQYSFSDPVLPSALARWVAGSASLHWSPAKPEPRKKAGLAASASLQPALSGALQNGPRLGQHRSCSRLQPDPVNSAAESAHATAASMETVAQADASNMRQAANFEKRARVRAQQEAASLRGSQEALQAALQKATADFAAQEAFARQADAAAKESAQLSCKNLYDMEAAVQGCSNLVRDMSELKMCYERSEAALQATNAQCAQLNQQLLAKQQELGGQAQWQTALQQQLNEERSGRQWLEQQAAMAAGESKKEVQKLQQQAQAASSDWQRAYQQLQQQEQALKADLSRCQASLSAERGAAESSNLEAKQLRLQMQQLLSQQQAAVQQLQEEATACKQDAVRYRSERDQALYDLAQLAEAKAAADQNIAAHWRAGAAKDAAIKDTSMKLASAIAQAGQYRNERDALRAPPGSRGSTGQAFGQVPRSKFLQHVQQPVLQPPRLPLQSISNQPGSGRRT
ncbi:hypothetical protein WJX74_001141 [Apatococcus lobatus]|uniref:Uncharacterized protein n=1 Tax=Apatococcus lobatus TaxID=904363 RepID=A0AAW1RV55_9CHLO